MNDFLTRITAPALGSATFATDLREVFQNIDDNFKKIVSAPYLEGQEGNSVEAYDMPIVEDGELTGFGLGMVREIFSDPTIESIQDIAERYPSVGSTPEHTAYECLVENPTMKVLRTIDPDTGQVDKWICSAEYYCFIDMRIEDLGNSGYPSTQTTFIDYSCLVFAERNGDSWVFSKGNMMPTLYYSAEQGCFCWKVNGAETGIRAQGVKGDDGRPPKAAVVKGFGSTSDIDGTKIVHVSVTDYSVFETHVETGGELYVQASWGDIQDSGLMDGDLVVCIFDIVDPVYQMTYPDMLIGNIRIVGDQSDNSAVYTITCPDANRFSSLWRSYILFYAFRDIDYKSTDTKKTKAIFVPAYTAGVTHAMFQDDSGVEYTRTGGSWQSEDLQQEDNLVFKKVREEKLVGSQSVGNESRMSSEDPYTVGTSKVKFLGYDMEVEGTSKAKVSGLSGVTLGVPVGTIVSWLDSVQVPEGWFVCGETSSYVAPVFGMRYMGIDSEDFDVAVKNGDATIAKLVFTGIEDGALGQRDLRYRNIFTALTGNGPELPIDIQTEATTMMEFLSGDRFGWTEFDLEETSGGLAFYLTKLV